MTAALAAEGLSVSFGSLHAVANVDLVLPAGARHALIGPNGAGKTTFVSLLTGALAPDRGRVRLHGEDVTRASVPARVKRGLGRTFQVTSLFPEMTAFEAVALALAERDGLTWRCLRPLARRERRDEAAAILGRLGALPQADRPLGTLAYGQQRVMEIALALAGRPRVLLLDEPAAGIPAGESTRLFEVLESLPADLALLFIEHDMHLVRRFARTVTVMAGGAVLAEGSPAEVAADPAVREAYLGRRRA
ncbi:ABC transporter ATP-binding protein [uncultured Methylobacterium sp.]|uniref:ABC transporter ATP-binding protein n=1 Tax=uncultured Methylobacterium sp. TaxID=157278 RepID=UPI00262E89BC|nr:ABC transporter ATP-binding protein [uncultured Methylobacterium sp.]